MFTASQKPKGKLRKISFKAGYLINNRVKGASLAIKIQLQKVVKPTMQH